MKDPPTVRVLWRNRARVGANGVYEALSASAIGVLVGAMFNRDILAVNGA